MCADTGSLSFTPMWKVPWCVTLTFPIPSSRLLIFHPVLDPGWSFSWDVSPPQVVSGGILLATTSTSQTGRQTPELI